MGAEERNMCGQENAGRESASYSSSFFAAISRMKYIERWALMRSSRRENLSEHAMEVAMIAHALCSIGNVRFGRHLDADRAAVIGLFHDASEIITGDMPTPVKYYNDEIRSAYKDVEAVAERRLLSRLPDDLKPVYEDIFGIGRPSGVSGTESVETSGTSGAQGGETSGIRTAADRSAAEHAGDADERYLRRLIKAADKLSALIKCIEEEQAGNREFRTAKDSTEKAVRKLSEELPEVKVYVEDFLPAYGHTLDELS